MKPTFTQRHPYVSVFLLAFFLTALITLLVFNFATVSFVMFGLLAKAIPAVAAANLATPLVALIESAAWTLIISVGLTFIAFLGSLAQGARQKPQTSNMKHDEIDDGFIDLSDSEEEELDLTDEYGATQLLKNSMRFVFVSAPTTILDWLGTGITGTASLVSYGVTGTASVLQRGLSGVWNAVSSPLRRQKASPVREHEASTVHQSPIRTEQPVQTVSNHLRPLQEFFLADQRYVSRMGKLKSIFQRESITTHIPQAERGLLETLLMPRFGYFAKALFEMPTVISDDRLEGILDAIEDAIKGSATIIEHYKEYNLHILQFTMLVNAHVIREVQHLQDTKQALQHHLISPVQHLPRYGLLFDAFHKAYNAYEGMCHQRLTQIARIRDAFKDMAGQVNEALREAQTSSLAPQPVS